MAKLATLSFDNITGFFEMAKGEQMGEINDNRSTKGDWGLKWNSLMGGWDDMVKLCNQIADVQGITVIMIGHIVGNYLNLGVDEKGNPQKKLIGWKVDVPGMGADTVLVPFDEVYNLVTQPTLTGSAPARKLITQPHLIEDYPFDAKSRKGIGSQGAITSPTYEKIVKSLPAGRTMPVKFLFVGRPGAGKSTLANTFPTPICHIDIQGGCDEFAKEKDRIVVKPTSVAELYKLLLKVRRTGEV